MRSSIIVVGILAFFVPSEASAQTKLSQKDLDQFMKLGIYLHSDSGPDGRDTWGASVRPIDQDTLQGLDLLQEIQNLHEIGFAKGDAKWMTARLERLKDFPKLKGLRVESMALGEDDVKSIAKHQALEYVILECPKFSEAQIKSIGGMKSLKSFRLAAVEFPPKAAATLRVALPMVRFDLEQIPTILSAPLVDVAKNDAPLVKLQKAKLNAALQGMKKICEASRIRGGWRGDKDSLEMMRQLKEALLDLDEPAFTERIVRDYVNLAEIAFNSNEMRFQRDDFPSEQNHSLEYLYLDAQIIQLKMKKKLDDKKP